MMKKIPFYKQSTEFTCDPACLIMAIKYFLPRTKINLDLELNIWRESYGIGIPGCMPQGLAYSASLRGLDSVIICRRSEMNKITLKMTNKEDIPISIYVSKKFFQGALRRKTKIIYKKPTLTDLQEYLSIGVPVVMINMNKLHGKNSPHWVVFTGYDDKHVWIHDPYMSNGNRTKINKDDFVSMMNDMKKLSGIEQRAIVFFKQDSSHVLGD